MKYSLFIRFGNGDCGTRSFGSRLDRSRFPSKRVPRRTGGMAPQKTQQTGQQVFELPIHVFWLPTFYHKR